MNAELNNQEMSAIQISASIGKAWEDYIIHENSSSPSKRQCTYASSYELCDRKMVLYMTEGDKVLPFPTEVLAKFHRGNDRERNMIVDLTRVGQFANPQFNVVGQQERFELKDHKGRTAIVGKVDLRLDYGYRMPKIPVECKDWHSNLTDRIRNFDDVFENQWTRKGAYQLLCYLFASGEKNGILLLPGSGFPKLIPVELYPYLDKVEEFLQKAERALDHKEAGTLPDFIQDADECKRCSFYGSVCNPPTMSGEGVMVITDPEVEQMLERREELAEASKEYKKIDDKIKSRFRELEYGIAGKFLLHGSWGKNTVYEIPDEIKVKYMKTGDSKDSEPQGKFTLKITKL